MRKVFGARRGLFLKSSGSAPPQLAPSIIGGPIEDVITETTVTLLWTTDYPSDSQAYLSSAYDNPSNYDGALVTTHSLEVYALSPGTHYNYYVRSANAQGEIDSNTLEFFSTAAIISNVVVTTDTNPGGGAYSQAIVTWTTNIPTYQNSFHYGEFDVGENQVFTDTGDGQTSHSITLNGLTQDVTYIFSIQHGDTLSAEDDWYNGV